MSTALHTLANPYRRVLAANSTTNGFSAKVDTLTAPTVAAEGESAGGYVYLTLQDGGLQPPNCVLIKPYGVGANDATGAMRVYGVKEVKKTGATSSYTHVLLGEWTFVLSSTLTGVASGVVVATEYYADTITKVTGLENVSEQVLSPTADEPAHLLLDCKGHALLLIELSTAGSATSVNALFAGV
jgi:hypothetical protein